MDTTFQNPSDSNIENFPCEYEKIAKKKINNTDISCTQQLALSSCLKNKQIVEFVYFKAPLPRYIVIMSKLEIKIFVIYTQ